MLVLRAATHHFNGRSYGGDQIAGGERQVIFAGLDFGDVQHVVNQAQEMLPLCSIALMSSR